MPRPGRPTRRPAIDTSGRPPPDPPLGCARRTPLRGRRGRIGDPGGAGRSTAGAGRWLEGDPPDAAGSRALLRGSAHQLHPVHHASKHLRRMTGRFSARRREMAVLPRPAALARLRLRGERCEKSFVLEPTDRRVERAHGYRPPGSPFDLAAHRGTVRVVAQTDSGRKVPGTRKGLRGEINSTYECKWARAGGEAVCVVML